MTKNEKIAYTSGWISHSYSVTPQKYRSKALQTAYNKGVADRAVMYDKQMQSIRNEMKGK